MRTARFPRSVGMQTPQYTDPLPPLDADPLPLLDADPLPLDVDPLPLDVDQPRSCDL